MELLPKLSSPEIDPPGRWQPNIAHIVSRQPRVAIILQAPQRGGALTPALTQDARRRQCRRVIRSHRHLLMSTPIMNRQCLFSRKVPFRMRCVLSLWRETRLFAQGRGPAGGVYTLYIKCASLTLACRTQATGKYHAMRAA